MNAQDKKLVVFNFLIQELEPINLFDLIKKLPEEFKERTVRRWLNQLILEGKVEKIGQKRGTKYQVVKSLNKPNLEEVNKTSSSCFSEKSLKAVNYIQRPLYEREPIAYSDEWFASYQPNTTFYFSKSIRDQLHEAGSRASDNDPAGTYARQIFNRLLIDLSYNSSRLEGNTYSQIDTERLILKGSGVEGKLDEEKVMILNHKEAIRYLVDNAPRLSVKEQTVYTLHYLLSDGLLEAEYTGKIRDHWVRISGSSYVPFEDSRRLKDQLNQVMSKAEQINDPFEQGLFLLIHISYLQPFADVNKRTARLAANIPLIIRNLVPLSFNDIKREDYMLAILSVYELQDVQPMVDLFVFSYMRTCVAYDSTVKAMGFDEVRVRYRKQRRSIIREIILQKKIGQLLEGYIYSEAIKQVPLEVQMDFIQDIKEDLEQLDESRIVGLGVTVLELQEWLALYKASFN